MRVTQQMMNLQLITNLNANNTRMSTYQEELATGKKINQPSDDPIGVGYAMRYSAQLSQNGQFQQNVDAGTSQLNFVDTTLNQINAALKRARELAVQGANGSLSSEDMKATSSEIQQLKQQLVSLGNTELNGHYIFNGQTTDIKPYDENLAATQDTDTGVIEYQMSEGVSIPVNVTGKDVFGASADADNAFKVMDELYTDLTTNNQADIQNNVLDKFDSRMGKITQVWSDVGARANRVNLISNRLKDLNTNITDLLSKTEDADVPQTIMNMQMAQNVQNASLATGSKIIQPTLVDFLR